MTLAIAKPKTFISFKRQCSARSFSASQRRTCLLPGFGFSVSLVLFCRYLT